MSEHRFAILTACATFLLLVVGGTVNPTGSSLACPEAWFVCHGSMLPEMTGGVLFEHGHRLVAMTVGLLQVVLTGLLWRRRTGSLRHLGLLALLLVCVQGSLGALTVQYQLPLPVSTAHLMVAFLYFSLVLYLAWRTRPHAARSAGPPVGRATQAWLGAAALAVYVQVALGALVRHSGGALASLDLPLHYGSLWPDPANLPLRLHMAHRLVGVVVGLFVTVAALYAARHLAGHPRLRALAVAVPVLVCSQIALGVATIWTVRAVPVTVAHVGGAAGLWAALVVLFLGARSAASLAEQPRSVTPMLREAVSP
jgi:heme a synthase